MNMPIIVTDSKQVFGESGDLAAIAFEFEDDHGERGKLLATTDNDGEAVGLVFTDPRGGDTEGNVNYNTVLTIRSHTIQGPGLIYGEVLYLAGGRATDKLKGTFVDHLSISPSVTLINCLVSGAKEVASARA